jgi:hypothetical protein
MMFTKFQTTHCFLRVSDYIAPQRKAPLIMSGLRIDPFLKKEVARQ